MPVKISQDAERGFVCCKYQGPVTDRELFGAYKNFCEGPDWQPGMAELIDLSEADMTAITSDCLGQLGAYTKELLNKHGIKQNKTAIYAPDVLQFGLSRVYEALAVETPELVKVFKDLDSAKEWLNPPTPGQHPDQR